MQGILELLANLKRANDYSNQAEKLTNHTDGWANNGNGDALRHAIAGGLIARNISPEAAKSANWIHENILGLGQPDSEKEMDLANTQFGITYGPSFPSDQEFIEYLHRVKNTGLLKKINKSHRYTAEQQDY
jgi:hypothetical protein